MRGQPLLKLLAALAAAAILAVDASPAGRHLLRLPTAVTLAVGEPQAIALALPGRVAVRVGGGPAPLLVDGQTPPPGWSLLPGRSLGLQPTAPGAYTVRLRLFGFLPWRSVRVQAVVPPRLVPGGQAVGVLLRSRGPLVVGETAVPGPFGPVRSPAAAAGIRVGDVLVAVDGRGVASSGAVDRALGRGAPAGPVPVTVLRRGRQLRLWVRPVYDPADGRYHMGTWVRETTGGIGTLTFTSPTGAFAALGHVVLDPVAGVPVVLGAGRLVPSLIAGVDPSSGGHPGEKLGVLVPGAPSLGTVTANTPFGVFGVLHRQPAPGPVTRPLAVALPDQVHPGPAEMLTVLHGGGVEGFAVRITAVLPQRRARLRGFLVRVTDPRLLRASGGIVQGMSGSPVLQGGRLVGAVTHVFVDAPTRGYGVLALWMAQAAGLGAGSQAA